MNESALDLNESAPSTVVNGRDPVTGVFLPGNQAGATAKKLKPATVFKRIMSQEDTEALLLDAVQKAKNGDPQWQAWLLSKVYGGVKPTAPLIELDIDFMGDTTASMKQVLNKVADGTLASDQARDLLASIASVEQVAKMADLEARLEQMEERGRLG